MHQAISPPKTADEKTRSKGSSSDRPSPSAAIASMASVRVLSLINLEEDAEDHVHLLMKRRVHLNDRRFFIGFRDRDRAVI